MTQITVSPAPKADEARNQPREFAAYSLLQKGGKIDSEARTLPACAPPC